MAVEESPPSKSPQEDSEHGVYQISDIPIKAIAELDDAKIKFLLNAYSFKADYMAEQLIGLLTAMQGELERNLKDDKFTYKVKEKDGKEYCINDYIEELESTNPKIINKANLRLISKNGFSIWNHYLKQLKVALFTRRTNPFRKTH